MFFVAEAAIKKANGIYARNGGNVQIHVDPGFNFNGLIKNTTMIQDCKLASGQTAGTIAKNKKRDLNGNGKADKEDSWVLCDSRPRAAARTAWALKYPDKLVVYSRGGNTYAKWNKKEKHWELKSRSGGFSSALGYYVTMPKKFGGSTLLAHEMGHYLHTAHPFRGGPATIAAAAKIIAKNGIGLKVFDGDSRAHFSVHDTPPDAGTGIFKTVYGDHCDPAKGKISIPVKVGNRTKTYTLAPDRRNVMSYFKGCPFKFHMTRGQYKRINEGLETGNRGTLGDKGFSAAYRRLSRQAQQAMEG